MRDLGWAIVAMVTLSMVDGHALAAGMGKSIQSTGALIVFLDW